MGGRYGMWSRYTIDVGQSVVRIGGLFVLHPYPENSELLPLQEGVDYFLGGRTYDISDQTATELLAAGFNLDGSPVTDDGFGEGGFGTGPFGDPNPNAPGFGEGDFGEGGYGQ